MDTLWTCPKCNRQFKNRNQSHSCTTFLLDDHFKNKEAVARPLFQHLCQKIEKHIGPLKIESVPCCIHLVSNYTFGAVWAFKDKIKIDIRLDHEIEDPRITRSIKMSAHRHLYYFDLKDKKEIDRRLLSWIKEAYELNQKTS